jgi:hypothetical protein
MLPVTPSVGQLSQVISQAAPPAFGCLHCRPYFPPEQDYRSIALTLLVIVAFVTAFFQLQHERGVALFFMISLGAFTVSLVDFR